MQAHWHILGAGAIGGVFARRLALLKQNVTLLTRNDTTGYRQLTYFNASSDGPDTHTFDEEHISSTGKIQFLLLCTKAFDTSAALRAVVERLAPDAMVVVLSNGMGYHRHLAAMLPTQQLIAGTTTTGVYQPDRGTRILAGAGITQLGWFNLDAPPPTWFNQLTQSDRGCCWVTDIQNVLLRKLAVNCVINPFTALANVANGELLMACHADRLEQAILEVRRILTATGHAHIASDLQQTIKKVLKDTAQNTSSMRADLQHNRATEVDAILGFLLEDLPEQSNVIHVPPTPLLSSWLNALRQRVPDHE